MKTKITFIITAIAIILGLQSCLDTCDEPHKREINSNDFDFKAVNLTIDDRKLSATAGASTVSVNWTVNITINGETASASGTSKSNELPVMAGNEIEIQFKPSRPEQTEAYFTMPDGSTYKATVNSPSFKWTVPDNFTTGMQIKGETRYETDEYIYIETGTITLVAIK